jgi:hypothetical protein
MENKKRPSVMALLARGAYLTFHVVTMLSFTVKEVSASSPFDSYNLDFYPVLITSQTEPNYQPETAYFEVPALDLSLVKAVLAENDMSEDVVDSMMSELTDQAAENSEAKNNNAVEEDENPPEIIDKANIDIIPDSDEKKLEDNATEEFDDNDDNDEDESEDTSNNGNSGNANSNKDKDDKNDNGNNGNGNNDNANNVNGNNSDENNDGNNGNNDNKDKEDKGKKENDDEDNGNNGNGNGNGNNGNGNGNGNS